MSAPLLPLIIQDLSSIESQSDTSEQISVSENYFYDFCHNENYDSDFLVSCAVSIIIFIYVHVLDYILKSKL